MYEQKGSVDLFQRQTIKYTLLLTDQQITINGLKTCFYAYLILYFFFRRIAVYVSSIVERMQLVSVENLT